MPASVEAYIAAQPAEVGERLRTLRAAIRKALPSAEEGISYGLPTYRLDGVAVIHFAGWKRYCSLYPVNARLAAALGEEIAPYLAPKSTLRLAHEAPLPLELIGKVATLRAHQVTGANKRG